jgi:hypothetical protein
MVTGVGEGVGVGEADGVGEGVGVGEADGAGVGVGDAVGPGLGVGVGLEVALLPLVAALEELPPPQPTNPNNMHARTAMARYLNIRAALLRDRDFRVRELEMQQSSCRMFSVREPGFPDSRDSQVRTYGERYKAGGTPPNAPFPHSPMASNQLHWLGFRGRAEMLEYSRTCH